MNQATKLVLQAILSAIGIIASSPLGGALKALAGWIGYMQAQAVAGVGAITITGPAVTATASQLQSKAITFVGVLTANTTVTMPLLQGNQMVFTNNTSGDFTLRIKDVGNKLIYLAPGQSKTIAFDVNGTMRCDVDNLFVARKTIDLAGAVGAQLETIAVFPAGSLITGYQILGEVSAVGGTSTQSLGQDVGGTDILDPSTIPSTANGITGPDPALWGTFVDASTGQALAVADITVKHLNTITVNPITAGRVEVEVRALIISSSNPGLWPPPPRWASRTPCRPSQWPSGPRGASPRASMGGP